MPQPKLRDVEVAELLAISDRVERVAQITKAGRRIGTLPKPLSEQRKTDLRELRKSHPLGDLAELISLAKSGICRLAPNPVTTEASA